MIETKLNLNSPELLELKKRLERDIQGTTRLGTTVDSSVVQGIYIALLELENLDKPYNAEWDEEAAK